MAAALVMVAGCSSDKNDPDAPDNPDQPIPTNQREWTASESRPAWQIDWSANVERPQWTISNPLNYENWMLMLVRVQDELLPYVSQDDLMSVTIDGELRAVAKPAQDMSSESQANNYFLMKILGNEDSEKVINYTVSYYNARLRQLFKLTGQAHFIAEKVYGAEEDYCLDFLSACDKYPVKSQLTLLLPEDITPAAGDMLAIFVGNECRGVWDIDDNTDPKTIQLTAFGREEGEQATVSYYSRILGTTTFDTTFKLSSSHQVLTLK